MSLTGERFRIDTLRHLVSGSDVLSTWPELIDFLAACPSDEEAETAFLGAEYFTRLRSRSQETMGMVREARRRKLPYELTVTDDPTAARDKDRYEIELSMTYPLRKNARRP